MISWIKAVLIFKWLRYNACELFLFVFKSMLGILQSQRELVWNVGNIPHAFLYKNSCNIGINTDLTICYSWNTHWLLLLPRHFYLENCFLKLGHLTSYPVFFVVSAGLNGYFSHWTFVLFLLVGLFKVAPIPWGNRRAQPQPGMILVETRVHSQGGICRMGFRLCHQVQLRKAASVIP